jgi:leader peptidase (prepilin peptidase)/N-methyltransferase
MRALGGMAAFAGIYLVLRLAYPQSLPFGDVELAGLLGLYLGWLGMAPLLLGTFLALLIAAVGGVARVASAPRHSAGALTLAPAMVSATVLSLFVAVPLCSWYGSVLAVAR